MFFRIIEGQKEVLYNTAHIWKIEVSYGEAGWRTSLKSGLTNENTTRAYKIFIGTKEIFLEANPDSKVMKVIEDIYKNAAKDPSDETMGDAD